MDYLHQIHMHANVVLREVTILLYLSFPNNQCLFLYVITQGLKYTDSCLPVNQ